MRQCVNGFNFILAILHFLESIFYVCESVLSYYNVKMKTKKKRKSHNNRQNEGEEKKCKTNLFAFVSHSK